MRHLRCRALRAGTLRFAQSDDHFMIVLMDRHEVGPYESMAAARPPGGYPAETAPTSSTIEPGETHEIQPVDRAGDVGGR
jgi:hypothetical protein